MPDIAHKLPRFAPATAEEIALDEWLEKAWAEIMRPRMAVLPDGVEHDLVDFVVKAVKAKYFSTLSIHK